MRFLALPLLATLSVVGLSPRAQSPSPAPLVVLVHGRGHLDDDSASLRRAWKQHLDASLASVGMPGLRNEDVRLAWYADVLDPESSAACGNGGGSSGSEDSLDIGVLARGLLGTLTAAFTREESRGLRGLIGDMLYVADWSKRCAAERRVGSVIESAAREKRPVIVLAYSLGSLVTYGYLESNASRGTVPVELRLITVGSPLGVPELRELMLGRTTSTLPVPAGVTAWENVYDPSDVFSGPLNGTVSTMTVRDRVVQSAPGDDSHYVGRYLRDRSTGVALGRALCATAAERNRPACDRLSTD